MKTISFIDWIAKVLRDAVPWVASRGTQRDAGSLRIAESKRRMERGLLATGTSRSLARKTVAEHFSRRAL